jgi:peptide/nickel transport system ATP-binding protein
VSAAGGKIGEPLLEVRDLHVHFPTPDGIVKAVDGLTFSVHRGETFGIVGESGSGKSVTCLTALGLINRKSAIVSGEIVFKGLDLISLPPERLPSIRGKELAMIFQDPFASLHPMYRVGDQLVEAVLVHEDISKSAAREKVVDMLSQVGIPNPRERFRDYPHQYSGGMRQRAMIAMALLHNPDILIADEPTTALDVTVQAQILDLIRDLQREFNSAVIIITHDLGVVAELADDIQVMYAGRAIEYSTAEDIFDQPQHPYTWGLLGSMPRIDRERTERLIPIKGTPPSLINVPQGCAFNPRCDYAHLNGGASETERPELLDIGDGHLVACHLSPEERKKAWETDIKPKL